MDEMIGFPKGRTVRHKTLNRTGIVCSVPRQIARSELVSVHIDEFDCTVDWETSRLELLPEPLPVVTELAQADVSVEMPVAEPVEPTISVAELESEVEISELGFSYPQPILVPYLV